MEGFKRNIEFQLCSEADAPLKKTNFISQIKHDGRRVAVIKEGSDIYLWGRDNIVSENYPEIIKAFKKIPGNFIVDTEFAVFTDEVKTDRGILQSRDKLRDKFKIKLLSNMHPATSIVFDLLEFNGQDLRNKAYAERKKIINDNFGQFNSPNMKVAKDWMDPEEAWKFAEEHKLEGIVEKDITSPYVGKRTDTWIKVKRKEIILRKMVSYEVSNAGITLISETGDRVACHGQQHKAVKESIDSKGSAMVECRRMAGDTAKGKSREIVFWGLVQNEQSRSKALEDAGPGDDSKPIVRRADPKGKAKQADKPIQPNVTKAGESSSGDTSAGDVKANPDKDRSLAGFGFGS